MRPAIKRAVQIVIVGAISFVLFLFGSRYNWHSEDISESSLGYRSEETPTSEGIGQDAISPPITAPLPSETGDIAIPKEPREAILVLREQYKNDDIIGYLRIEGTSVDYPVTQANDNIFYLNNDIYKQANVTGWIFMDYENDAAHEDKNTVIYGHNMKKDIMFHSLRYYVSNDFLSEHRYIVFDTIYDEQVWEVFSFYETDTSFHYIQVIFPTLEDFYELALEMKAKSLYNTDVTVTPEDRILTLSTCSGRTDDSRYVLNARLLKPDEIPTDLMDVRYSSK